MVQTSKDGVLRFVVKDLWSDYGGYNGHHYFVDLPTVRDLLYNMKL